MRAKHTPGPWSSYSGVICRPGTEIARISGGPSGRATKTGQANARLIAAAPDLLEALRAILDAPSTADQYTGSFAKVLASGEIEKARAAIAKAEGRG